MTSEKERQKIQMHISQYLRLRGIIFEKAERFGVRFALMCDITSNYMLVNLDQCEISIEYFVYNYGEYDTHDFDQKIDSIVIPYEALCDKDVWIQKILTDRKKSVKSEEFEKLKDELCSLKKDRDLAKDRSETLEEKYDKLVIEYKIKTLSKE